ncbi:TPA: hypothetical protein PMC50_002834 [Vibrio cholerae]|nr:hypothetical protein [Vibrio cholerae]
MIKLKTKDLKSLREEMVLANPLCSLCGKDMTEKQRIALDHCHVSGRIREPLCSWCNVNLGKIENAAIRTVGKDSLLTFLINAVQYIQFHQQNPSDLEHPTHNKPKKRKPRAEPLH